MANSRSKFAGFLEQLRRRGVLPAAVGYGLIAWILLQVAEVTFEPLHLPDWALTVLIIIAIVGFPVVMVLAWFFDLTFKGFKRDSADATVANRAVTSHQHTLGTAPGPSVAVLAFDDMSPDKDQDYLCEGIAEEILNRLAQIETLRVASRTSSFRFKEKPDDIISIGQMLKVGAVLEGSVRKAGDRLRITTELIDVANGYQLWSQSFDRELENIFDIQDEIASNVANALEVKLARKAIGPGDTENVKAYEFYLRGLHYFHRWGMRNMRYAIDMFTKAVESDPHFARGWAALADSHAMVYLYWSATEEYMEGTARASEKSLELAPDLAEAHISRGLAQSVRGQSADAIAEFEIALELNPGLFAAYYFYARVCFQQGELERAAALFERAEQVRPDDFQAPILLRQIYRALGRDDEARDAGRRGVQRAEQHLELNPDDTRALNLGLGGLAELGEKEKLMQWAERTLAIDGDNSDTLYNVACSYALIGEVELALDCLEKANLGGTAIAEWAQNDADLVPLHDHPRFRALMNRLKEHDSRTTDFWSG